MMQHIPVESSNIASIAYDEGTELFEATFKDGSTYRYEHVTYEMWQDLHYTIQKHESIGRWFHANIRALPTRFPFVKVQAKNAIKVEDKTGEQKQ